MINKTINPDDPQLNVKDMLLQITSRLRGEISVMELCPYGESLRLDALSFNRYDRIIRGYEIKLTRPDFLQDKKWQRYLPFCNYFSFVAPKNIIGKDELPPGIGLIEVWIEQKKSWDDTIGYRHRVRSEITKKMSRLDKVSIENYIKVLEGIALKASYKTDNIL